jgi:SAM-dependent methyltransferase
VQAKAPEADMKTKLNSAVNEKGQRALSQARLFLGVVADLGRTLDSRASILDLGCGKGWMVYAFRQLGYRAFGTDILSVSSLVYARMQREGLCLSGEQVFSTVNSSDCRLPYDDNSFDLVVSYDVMEHIKNYPAVFAEIERVLKPSGKSLHSFPSRYRPIEPHVSIPLATIFQQYRFLLFWSWLGFGLGANKRTDARRISLENSQYLKASTQYLSKRKLVDSVASHCREIQFVEKYAWRHDCGAGGLVYRVLERVGLTSLLPIMAFLLSPFSRRVLLCARPIHESEEKLAEQVLSPQPWLSRWRAAHSVSGR